MVSKETEDLRKARNDTKSKHLLLNTAASRKRLKDLNGSKRGTRVTQISHQELLIEWKKYRSTLLNNTTAIDTARLPPDESVLPINTA